MAGALEGDVFIGPKAKDHRGLLNIKYPIEHGIVTDWGEMEQIWNVSGCDKAIPNKFSVSRLNSQEHLHAVE